MYLCSFTPQIPSNINKQKQTRIFAQHARLIADNDGIQSQKFFKATTTKRTKHK